MPEKVSKTQTQLPAAFENTDLKTQWIPVRQLIIKWPGAQRLLKSDTHAKTIAARFDPDKFGLIQVTEADDRGLHHVVDGFNRVRAVDMLWGKEEKVPCIVLPIRDPVRAAQVFLGVNRGRRIVSTIDTFKVGVQAGEEDKVAINKIVRGCGYRIDSNKLEGAISAVGSLTQVYVRYGGKTLTDTLTLIQATWGMDPNAVVGPIIMGFGSFLATYDKANWGRLKEALQRRFTPGSLLGAARALREAERGGLNDAMVRVLVNAYNRSGRGGHRLDI